jgi:hypothetical protein
VRYVEARHPDSGCKMDGFTWWLQTELVSDVHGRGGLWRMPRTVRCVLCDMEPENVAMYSTLPPHATA